MQKNKFQMNSNFLKEHLEATYPNLPILNIIFSYIYIFIINYYSKGFTEKIQLLNAVKGKCFESFVTY